MFKIYRPSWVIWSMLVGMVVYWPTHGRATPWNLPSGTSSHPTGKSASAQSTQTRSVESNTLLSSPFARYVFRWGQQFQTHLPKGWRMDWEPTQLTDIQWQAGPQLGYQIKFEHVTRKVPIPVPFPDFKNPTANTLVVPVRCSLHFFPRSGAFQAYESPISRITPATLIGVTEQAIVLQPNRFLAKEYPCPDILLAFSRFTRPFHRGKPVHTKVHQILRRAGLRRYKLLRHKHHLMLSITGPKQSLPWRNILLATRHKTLVIRFQNTQQHWDIIFHL